MGRDTGFTLLEFVLVLIVSAVLLGTAAGYYIQLHKAMQIESIKTQANNFRAAVTTLRSQWMINRMDINERSYLWNDKPVYLTEQGWLANSHALMSAKDNDQTAYECWQLWQVIFNSVHKVTFEGGGVKKSGEQHVSSLSGQGCRFEISNTAEKDHFFDYFLATGQVSVGSMDR